MLTIRWICFLRRLGLLLGIYFLLRLLFLALNHRALGGADFGRVLWAFVYGLRFDLAALAAINFPFLVLTFLPRSALQSPGYERFLKILFLALNAPFLVLNVIDLELFQFTGKRLTLQVFRLAGDAGVKWSSLLASYWPLACLWLVLILLLAALYDPARRHKAVDEHAGGEALALQTRKAAPGFWLWLLNLLLLFPLCIIGVRGGLQWRPIGPASAMALEHNGLAQLALNSSFTVLKSYGNTFLVRRHFFPSRDEVLHVLKPLVDGGERLLPPESRRDNVVILILESFSAEYWGAGNGGNRYTPFLDSLAAQSLFFERNYANGRASIEAMPSILAGLPALMERSFIESAFQSNELLGLGTVLARHGYTTSFFHGGKNGTMHFDVFMHLAGMQRYVGLNEYPCKEDYDGTWGIYDEPFLQFTAAELAKQRQPFATAIFTLSSHHPYAIPEKYRGRFRKGTLPIHEAIGYTDYAVGQFFAAARQQAWYTNTLFVITADHTQKLETPEYATTLGHYRVPLLFFHPGFALPKVDPARITQHVDIFPSILDFLGIAPERHLLFGKSVFRSGEGRAFLNVNGHYWLVRGEQALEFDGLGSAVFDLQKDPQLKSPIKSYSERPRQLEQEAKALVQYYDNGMLENNLYAR